MPEKKFFFRFLRELSNLTEGNILTLKTFSGKEEALEAVKDGRAWGMISMSSNFSRLFHVHL